MSGAKRPARCAGWVKEGDVLSNGKIHCEGDLIYLSCMCLFEKTHGVIVEASPKCKEHRNTPAKRHKEKDNTIPLALEFGKKGSR